MQLINFEKKILWKKYLRIRVNFSVTKVSNFWDLETLGICDNDNHPDQEFLDDIKTNSEGRYEFQLPFKANHPVLSDNFELAEKRLKSTLKKLKANPKLLKMYDDVFKEQKQFGII